MSQIQLVMPWLRDILLGKPVQAVMEELALAPAAVSAYLQDWEQHIGWLASALSETRCLFYTGRGPSLAAVGTGGLITKEAAHFPAEGMSSAAFRHGPLEMAAPGITVVVFAGRPETLDLNLRLAADINRLGGQALLVDADSPEAALRLPNAPTCLMPVLEILPIQMITLALSSLQDHTAGAFRHATKVTRTE